MGEGQRLCHRCGYRAASPEEVTCPNDRLHLIDEAEHARSPRDIFLGTTLGGRYPILGVLGAGGMGAVYRSIQPMVERPVAIKVILADMAFQAEEARRRFQREAKTIANLDHPAIVTLHDFGVEDDGTLFMVQELVAGRTLLSWLRGGGLSVRQVVEVALTVLDALGFAHDEGVVHRDIKPENVMLLAARCGSAQKQRIKLLDFGLAKLVGGSGASRLTRTGMVSGTPRYMSPEQAMDGPIDHRTDLYSLGSMLWEALAGRGPFEADNPLRLLAQKATRDPPPLPDLPHIPSGLGSVLARAMARLPEDRYPDAAAMARELRQVPLGSGCDTPLPPLAAPDSTEDAAPDGTPSAPANRGQGAEQSEPASSQLRQTLLDPEVHAVAGVTGPAPGSEEARETAASQPAPPPAPGLDASHPSETRWLDIGSRPQAALTVQEPLLPVDPAGAPPRPGRSRALTAIGAIAIVGIAATGVLLALRSFTGEGDSAAVAGETTEAGIRRAGDRTGAASGRSATASPSAALQSPAAASPTPVVAVTPPPPSPAPQVATVLAVLGTGSTAAPALTMQLRIHSIPTGAEVYAPGKKLLGTTPLILTLTGPVTPGGSNRYRIHAKGYVDQVITVPLDGQRHEAVVRLQKTPKKIVADHEAL